MKKPWLMSYPTDVPQTVNVDIFHSIPEAFAQICLKFQNQKALNNFGVRLTYAELNKASQYFAAFLQKQLNLEKSDRFAIMLPNILQFPIAVLGILRAGLTVVNINPLYTAPEISYQIKDAGIKGIVVLEDCLFELKKVLIEVDIQYVIIAKMSDYLDGVENSDHVQIPNAIFFQDVLKKGKDLQLQNVIINNDDVAFLQYTGGTTEVSKGAILTHRNFIAGVAQFVAWLKPTLVMGEEIVLIALPLYHIYAIAVCALGLSLGAECLLITNPRDMDAFMRKLKDYPPSVYFGVNTLFNNLLKHPAFSKLDFSNLKLTIGGGMATQKPVARKWKEVTGVMVHESYGLTEANPTAINPLTSEFFTGSIGLPIPNTEVAIRNDAGDDLSIGEVGELCVRGPQVMKGYWKKPKETDMVLDKNGWVRTGDIARIDENGFIYLLDRKKDMILVSGFNVFPSEIEKVIISHPEVNEVAVIGIPSETSGEAVKAFIVKKSDQLSAKEIMRYCRDRLTGYKLPKYIEFIDELPKSNVGKLLRRKLRNQQ